MEADAELVTSLLTAGVRALTHEFADHGPDELLREASCEVILYEAPNEKVWEGRALTRTPPLAEGFWVKIHLLAPSRHTSGTRTNVGEPRDENYFFMTLVHELSIIFLCQLTRRKRRGWWIYNAPEWFYEGYEQYLGLTRSSDHSRTVTMDKYVQEAQQALASHRGISELDLYIRGALLLKYMHENYGRERVQSILVSEEPTFASALERALMTNDTTLFENCKEWLIQA